MIVPDINLLIYAHNPDSPEHIAALAMEREAELHTNDGDFARFPGLRWRNPLL